jgi:hypothetical protein
MTRELSTLAGITPDSMEKPGPRGSGIKPCMVELMGLWYTGICLILDIIIIDQFKLIKRGP